MTPVRDSNYTWQTNDSSQGQQLHMTNQWLQSGKATTHDRQTNDSNQGQQLHMTHKWLQSGTATTHDKPMTPVRDSYYTWHTNDSSQGQQLHMTHQWLQSGKATTHDKPMTPIRDSALGRASQLWSASHDFEHNQRLQLFPSARNLTLIAS